MLQGAKTAREGILDLLFIPFALGQGEFLIFAYFGGGRYGFWSFT